MLLYYVGHGVLSTRGNMPDGDLHTPEPAEDPRPALGDPPRGAGHLSGQGAADDPGLLLCAQAIEALGVDSGRPGSALVDLDQSARVSAGTPSSTGPHVVAVLLGSLREAAALAGRAAAHAPLDRPHVVTVLREAGAREQAAALADRLPWAGMFWLFRQQADRQDRFRFGREADGSPAGP